MAHPTLASERSVTQLNHFRKDITRLFDDWFNAARNGGAVSWKNGFFRKVSLGGAYAVTNQLSNAPLPLPEVRGSEIQTAGLGELTYSLFSKPYMTPKMGMHIDDLRDSHSVVNIKKKMQEMAEYLARLIDFTFEELIEGAVSTFLHPETSFANLFGGSGLFSTTHSFFGQTLSNQVTQTGVSAGNFMDDLYSVRKAFRDMPDSNGRQFWDDTRETDAQLTVVIPNDLEQIVDEATISDMIVPSGSTAPATNVFKQVFGSKVTYHIDTLLTDTEDFYVAKKTEGLAPFIWGEVEGNKMIEWKLNASDEANATRVESMQWRRTDAFGVGDVPAIIKVA